MMKLEKRIQRRKGEAAMWIASLSFLLAIRRRAGDAEEERTHRAGSRRRVCFKPGRAGSAWPWPSVSVDSDSAGWPLN